MMEHIPAFLGFAAAAAVLVALFLGVERSRRAARRPELLPRRQGRLFW